MFSKVWIPCIFIWLHFQFWIIKTYLWSLPCCFIALYIDSKPHKVLAWNVLHLWYEINNPFLFNAWIKYFELLHSIFFKVMLCLYYCKIMSIFNKMWNSIEHFVIEITLWRYHIYLKNYTYVFSFGSWLMLSTLN